MANSSGAGDPGGSGSPTPNPADRAGEPPEVCFRTAVDLARLIRNGELSAREVLEAHLRVIERVNPRVNAIVTLVADRALADAARADEAQARGAPLGPLHGLPIAHKDLFDTAGIRTTRGSPFFRDNIPERDAIVVQRARAAGAVTVGKTNTPEFGAGSQTFNAIFGATRNPYALDRTCGGSSGGAAVALACGMVPLADGSDVGGSLRNPAAFCNVVGLRPAPGRVPDDTASWSPLPVAGPMGRCVADVALLLSAMAGPDARDPLSITEGGGRFAAPLGRNFAGTRIAWWRGLGGIPFAPEVRAAVDAQRATFEALGCVVEVDEPDFTGVDTAFPTLRHLAFQATYAPLAREHPEWLKDTIHWELAEAARLTGAQVADALVRQAGLYQEARRFFGRHDFFVLPVTQVAPFAVDTPYPTAIDGHPMSSYIDWMRSCWYVSLMATPAISVPAGFTASGLPVGLQIVAPHRGEWGLLQMAHAFEQATRYGWRRPPVATPA